MSTFYGLGIVLGIACGVSHLIFTSCDYYHTHFAGKEMNLPKATQFVVELGFDPRQFDLESLDS